MKSYIQILGAGAIDGGGPAVLVFFDEERYLFNCGEGLQRFCGEHKVKLGRLSHILLSRLDWDCVGGLPGINWLFKEDPIQLYRVDQYPG